MKSERALRACCLPRTRAPPTPTHVHCVCASRLCVREWVQEVHTHTHTHAAHTQRAERGVSPFSSVFVRLAVFHLLLRQGGFFACVTGSLGVSEVSTLGVCPPPHAHAGLCGQPCPGSGPLRFWLPVVLQSGDKHGLGTLIRAQGHGCGGSSQRASPVLLLRLTGVRGAVPPASCPPPRPGP